jgi:hypothetical protein
VKTLARESTAKRLVALEQQFIEIAKMTKGLRRYLDEVAETVRIAAEELRKGRMAKQRPTTNGKAARRSSAGASYARAAGRAAQEHHPVS